MWPSPLAGDRYAEGWNTTDSISSIASYSFAVARETVLAWFDWLLLPTCPLCQRPAPDATNCFCPDCTLNFPPPAAELWPTRTAETALPVYAWGRYAGALRRSLQLLKYQRQPRIGETFGHWLGRYWSRTCGSSPAVVIPIPLHRDRQRQRGYNQAEIVSRAFCRATGARHAPHLLHRTKVTAAQFGLNRPQRFHNLKRAFAADPRLASVQHPILLVDDIYTTGATMAAAQAAIANARPQANITGAISIALALPDDPT